jgi:hypothetical protein
VIVQHTAPEWTDEQVDAIVMGSGAELWPWYQSGHGIGQEVIAPGQYGRFTVDIDDNGEDSLFGDVKTVVFTRDDFRRVAAELAEGKHKVRWDIRDLIRKNDLDADAVDVVIQIIAYGEVVFG